MDMVDIIASQQPDPDDQSRQTDMVDYIAGLGTDEDPISRQGQQYQQVVQQVLQENRASTQEMAQMIAGAIGQLEQAIVQFSQALQQVGQQNIVTHRILTDLVAVQVESRDILKNPPPRTVSLAGMKKNSDGVITGATVSQKLQ